MSAFEEIPLTSAQKAVLYVSKNVKERKAVFDFILERFKTFYDGFWFSPDYSPQEINAVYDTKALNLFTNSKRTKDYLLSVDPNCLEDKYINPPLPAVPELVDGAPTGRMIIG